MENIFKKGLILGGLLAAAAALQTKWHEMEAEYLADKDEESAKK